MSRARSPLLQFWRARQLPIILQAEAAECGVACLAMIATYWGHRIDLPSMRRRFSVSLKGATLKGLIDISRGMALQARPLKLGLQRLSDLKLPCVLHWDMSHFVVLKSIGRQHAVIHDPAVGERRLAVAEVSGHFTGVALELTPAGNFEITEERERFTLFQLMGRVEGIKRNLAKMLVMGVALQVCALVAPFYLQWLVDNALVTGDRDLVTVLGIGFLLLVIIQALISAVRSWTTTTVATDLNFQWQGNAFAHLIQLPLAYFEKRHVGDVVSRFGSIQVIQRALTTQFVEAVIDGLLVVTTAIVMLLYSPVLTAVAICAVVLYACLRWTLYRSLRDANAEQITHAARQQTHFLESTRGVQSVRLFGRGEERRIGWMNILAMQFDAELRIARLSLSYQTASNLLFGIERVAVIWLAALAVLDAQFSAGMLFAFISYQDQFSQRIASLTDKLFDFRMLRLHGERVADVVLSEREAEFAQAEMETGHIHPSIELRNVSFRYADGEPLVLENLSLTIPAGQCVAIAGISGCGKTTLAKIALGLLTPTSGEVLVGGIKLDQLGLANYRQMVGTVMQEDQLFSGSIADNISFFDPSPEQQRVENCARIAAIHEEILSMPMAYNTLVGAMAGVLSGGQKQRILLARALYKNPRILLLDEATSHLDLGNERLVNAAIQQLPLTRIVIAHRPETIAMAQRVVVLERGCIVRDLVQPQLHQSPSERELA